MVSGLRIRDKSLSLRSAGSCQQYGHSCLGGHGKRDGSDSPIAARYNNLLREMLARRLYSTQNFNDWNSQEALEKKSIDYAAV